MSQHLRMRQVSAFLSFSHTYLNIYSLHFQIHSLSCLKNPKIFDQRGCHGEINKLLHRPGPDITIKSSGHGMLRINL